MFDVITCGQGFMTISTRSFTFVAMLAGVPAIGAQQQAGAPQLPRDEIAALARLQVAINIAHDSANLQLALPKNMTSQAQVALRSRLDVQIADILHHAGMTEAEFSRKAFVLSTDQASRKVFDSVVVAVTGAPLPGTYVAPAVPARAVVAVPAGAVGVHIGHVVNSFGDTPNAAGLLPTAMDEARIAATHASLATRQPANLDYMKTHAGHVINALDPTIEATGPGLKYGMKRAALGVATHIELAAKAEGASPKVVTHSAHVAMAARSTAARADSIIAIAQRIRASTTAAEAAALVSRMASLTEQLIPGFDVNADGKVGMEPGEGGLQMCEDHVKLMLAP